MKNSDLKVLRRFAENHLKSSVLGRDLLQKCVIFKLLQPFFLARKKIQKSKIQLLIAIFFRSLNQNSSVAPYLVFAYIWHWQSDYQILKLNPTPNFQYQISIPKFSTKF